MAFQIFKSAKTIAGMFTDSAGGEAARKMKLARREKEIDLTAADKELQYIAKHIPALAKEAARDGKTVVSYGADVKYKDENDDTDSSQWKFARGYIPEPVTHNALARLEHDEIKSLPGYAMLEQACKDKGFGMHFFESSYRDENNNNANSISIDFKPGTTRWVNEIPHPVPPKP
jgi:hypothetical protein